MFAIHKCTKRKGKFISVLLISHPPLFIQRKYLFYCAVHVRICHLISIVTCNVECFLRERKLSYLSPHDCKNVHDNNKNVHHILLLCRNKFSGKCFVIRPVAANAFNNVTLVSFAVPRKVLIDRFESTPESDEPLQMDDLELETDEELYDEDQFYKESDMSPGPAPKLQGDLAKKPQRFDSPVYTVTSSVSPPQRTRDDSSLEGTMSFCTDNFN